MTIHVSFRILNIKKHNQLLYKLMQQTSSISWYQREYNISPFFFFFTFDPSLNLAIWNLKKLKKHNNSEIV